ncbi:MAG: hypothetical protein AAFY46_08390 [Planctomycetota bacterium]
MNWNSMRATTIAAGLLAASGLAQPALAQAGTQTVQERVVVTLPNGKRIVRVIEKQVPVVQETATPAIDPFTLPGGDDNDSGGDSESRSGGGEVDPRIMEWVGWYRDGDMRADSNGDGRVTAADFNAFLKLLNDSKDDDGTDGGGDGFNGNDVNRGDDGSDDNSNDGGGHGSENNNGDDNGDDNINEQPQG